MPGWTTNWQNCGIDASPAGRAAARQLFARVLDLPGGMRIGTIHAFCQSLLRRFPLEARLSPHFRLVDEADATEALREAREDVLAEAHDLERRSDLSTLAGLATEQQFGRLVATLRSEPERLARAAALGRSGLLDALNRVLDAEPDDDAVLARAIAWAEEAALQPRLPRAGRSRLGEGRGEGGAAAGVAGAGRRAPGRRMAHLARRIFA